MLKENDIVKVDVKDERKELYHPSYLHSNIGYVYDIDTEHIYIKAFRKDVNGQAYVSSCDRYVLNDVYVKKVI